MFGMSNEQLLGLLRQFLPVIGTVLATLGWVKPGTWGVVTELVMQVAGPGLIIISAVWSVVDKTKASMIAKVDAMPEVAGVITTPTPAGAALANSVESSTVVPANTTSAAAVAKGSTGL